MSLAYVYIIMMEWRTWADGCACHDGRVFDASHLAFPGGRALIHGWSYFPVGLGIWKPGDGRDEPHCAKPKAEGILKYSPRRSDIVYQ